ncbi:MAG: hypothetical protein ABR497_11390, partial [Kiritimatiellia bacterium]|nr:hypothetical protein [Lentisphaerota bacterium]
QKETQKGALLSRQLLALSRSGLTGMPGAHLERYIEEAVALLRVALTPAWTVKLNFNGAYPVVPLTPGQIEQIILNLGLLAADALSGSGVLTVSLMRAGEGNLANVSDGMAVVLLLAAEAVPAAGRVDDASSTAVLDDEGGVILSVVSSMLEEVHGHVECLSSYSGASIYRVCLPQLAATERPAEEDALPAGFGDYLADWRIMLACAADEMGNLDNTLRSAGAQTERCENIMTLLGGVDDLQKNDALILDVKLLGEEVEGLLRAVLKLCPRLGVVVLCCDPAVGIPELKSAVAFAAYDEPVARLMQLLIISKALRAHRGEYVAPGG